MLGVEFSRQVASEPMPTGDILIRVQFDADETKPGTGGLVSLWMGDRQVGEGRIERTVPIAFSTYAGMDIGRDNGLVVAREYHDKAPYAFTGTVRKVVYDLKPGTLSEETALHESAHHQAVGVSAGNQSGSRCGHRVNTLPRTWSASSETRNAMSRATPSGEP